MRGFISLVRIKSYTKTFCKLMQNQSYTPINLSSKCFDPKNGHDDSLSPVIFMHGLSATKESWDNVPQIVADNTNRKAYAYDARNHGDSEFTSGFDFDLLVNDLFHFMDSKDISKAVLVGHSMGGQTATNAALAKPERFVAIFSEDIYVKKLSQDICNGVIGFIELWNSLVQKIPGDLNQAEAIQFLLNTMFAGVPEDSPLQSEKNSLYKTNYVLKKNSEGGFQVSYNKEVLLRSLKNASTLMTEPEGQFNGPATFIYGGLSGFQVNKEEDHIKKHFPQAKLVEFSKSAHNVHCEFPDEFSHVVINSLNSIN